MTWTPVITDRVGPIYRSIADLCVEVRGGKPDVVAATLGAFVRNRGG